MSKNMRGLITNHVAGAAVTKYLFAKFGADDDKAILADANTDLIIGVFTDLDAAQDARVDVCREGITPIVYGGTVTRGQPLTTDANGKAVVAVPALKQPEIDGGSAGDHTVTGILQTDELVSVLQVDIDTGNVVDVVDLTSEFTISAANTINNTGGTDTTGDTLIVTYRRNPTIAGRAEVSGVADDIGAIHLI